MAAHSVHRAAMKHSHALASPKTHSLATEKINRDDLMDKYIELPAWALGEKSRGGPVAGSMTMLAALMLCVLVAIIAGAALKVRAMRMKSPMEQPIYSPADSNAV